MANAYLQPANLDRSWNPRHAISSSNCLRPPALLGFEQPVQRLVQSYLSEVAERIDRDRHGNLIAVSGANHPLKVLLDGHCDQIGMIVNHIDDQGYLYAQPIGGWDPQQLIGQRMTIWTEKGPLTAVIARKPIHLLSDSERKQVVKLQDLWLDIGAVDGEQAGELVGIGDPVTLALGMAELANDRLTSPGMDNKTGLWVVVEAFRRAVVDPRPLHCGAYCVSSVAEEIGLRGARTAAFAVDPTVGIAVDVTHATDCPTIDSKQLGSLKLGDGPVVFRGPNMSPLVVEQLLQVGEKKQLPVQLAATGRATPNDANAIQINRSGVAAGLVSIPNRYMHSAVETISLADLDAAADLLCEFLLSLTGNEDFILQ